MKSKTKGFPEVSAELIDALTGAFPDKAPRDDVGLFSFGARAGEQGVIDFLKAKNRQQEKANDVQS